MKGWQPHRIGFAILLLYMIALSFLCVHLLEQNQKLREEAKACQFYIRATGGAR